MSGPVKFKDFPVQDKNNFRIYHEDHKEDDWPPPKPSEVRPSRNSIYLTTPDTPLEQKIVNEPKPQITIRYQTVRGKQFNGQSQSGKHPTKKKKITK